MSQIEGPESKQSQIGVFFLSNLKGAGKYLYYLSNLNGSNVRIVKGKDVESQIKSEQYVVRLPMRNIKKTDDYQRRMNTSNLDLTIEDGYFDQFITVC